MGTAYLASLADPGALATVGPPGQVASTVAGASGPVRAVAAVLLVVGLGGVLRWRYDPLLERSVDASTANPFASLGYGLAAHLVVVFGAVYLANKLTRYGVFGSASGYVGLGVGVVLAGIAAAFGFAVVGSSVADLLGARRPPAGLLVGATAAGVTAGSATEVGALVWFAVVSVGIGGAVREWVTASVVAEIEAGQSP